MKNSLEGVKGRMNIKFAHWSIKIYWRMTSSQIKTVLCSVVAAITGHLAATSTTLLENLLQEKVTFIEYDGDGCLILPRSNGS